MKYLGSPTSEYDIVNKKYVDQVAGGNGYITLASQTQYTGSLAITSTLTADRTYTLPDKTGTLATTDDITAAIAALDATNTAY